MKLICSLTCEHCQEPTDYCDSVPDANVPGTSPGECGYRLKPLCWLHAAERRQEATSRLSPVVRCIKAGFSRLDRDRCGGDVICEHCGRKYYDHPVEPEYPFLHLLCDGSVAKL